MTPDIDANHNFIDKDDLNLEDLDLIDLEKQKIKNLGSLKESSDSGPRAPGKSHSSNWSDVVWRNVAAFILLHGAGLYGLWLVISGQIMLPTMVAFYVMALVCSLGITAGAHRLWSHRSYKATWSLRLFLAYMNTMSLQNDVYEWCRDHRVHHKYSETNADPHNSNRGFFFAHMGWLLLRKHPDVISKGKQIDLSDLMADPIVRFQRRFYIPLVVLIWGMVPTYVPYWMFGESLWNGFFVCVAMRYMLTLHGTWLVNSAAHLYGTKPYNSTIQPRENHFVSNMALGEGYHNYHHTYPWDYSTSELGWSKNFNITTLFIEFAEKCGLAYDLKKPSPKLVQSRIEKIGDGSYDPEEIKNRNFGLWELGIFFLHLTYAIWIGFALKTVVNWWWRTSF